MTTIAAILTLNIGKLPQESSQWPTSNPNTYIQNEWDMPPSDTHNHTHWRYKQMFGRTLIRKREYPSKVEHRLNRNRKLAEHWAFQEFLQGCSFQELLKRTESSSITLVMLFAHPLDHWTKLIQDLKSEILKQVQFSLSDFTFSICSIILKSLIYTTRKSTLKHLLFCGH